MFHFTGLPYIKRLPRTMKPLPEALTLVAWIEKGLNSVGYSLQPRGYIDILPNSINTVRNATAPPQKLFVGGVYKTAFTDNHSNDEELSLSFQFPHGYIPDEDIDFHVHVSPATAPTAPNSVVEFGCEYYWDNVNDGTPTTTTLYKTLDMAGKAAKSHLIVSFPLISGTGMRLSSDFSCRLFRASKTRANDNYANDVFLRFADIHAPVDGLGSRDWYIR